MHMAISIHSGIACNNMTREDTGKCGLKRRMDQPAAVRPGAVVRFAWCGRACTGLVVRCLGRGHATGYHRFMVCSRDLPGTDLVLLYEYEIAEAA